MDFVNGRNMREGPCRSAPLKAKFCMDKAPGIHAEDGNDVQCVNGVWGDGWRKLFELHQAEPGSGRMDGADPIITWADKWPAWFTRENNFGGCNQFMIQNIGDLGGVVVEAPAGNYMEDGNTPNGMWVGFDKSRMSFIINNDGTPEYKSPDELPGTRFATRNDPANGNCYKHF